MIKFKKTIVLNLKRRLPISKTYLKEKAKNAKRRLIFFFKKNLYISNYKNTLLIRHNKKILITASFLKKRLKMNPKYFSRKNFNSYRSLFFKYKIGLCLSKKFDLYNRFIGFIFKNGKKLSWEYYFSKIFDSLSLKLKYTRNVLLLKIFIRLATRVEVKKVKARKHTTYIPIFIKLDRSLFLSLKWIFLSAKKKLGSISFQSKLFLELLQILVQKSCFSLQKRDENNTLAFTHRSNIHYRWQRTR